MNHCGWTGVSSGQTCRNIANSLAATVEWGAAVHGSSAFLQLTGVATTTAACADVPSAPAATTIGGGCEHSFSSFCPDNAKGPCHGNQQTSSWSLNLSAPGLAASVCHPHPAVPTASRWQQQDQHVSRYADYPPYDGYSQQCLYRDSCPDPAIQYGWLSYHAHSAKTWEQVASISADSWQGWTSFTGVRSPRADEAGPAARGVPPTPQLLSTTTCLKTTAAASGCGCADGSTTAAHVMGLDSPDGGAASDLELYDPLEHAEPAAAVAGTAGDTTFAAAGTTMAIASGPLPVREVTGGSLATALTAPVHLVTAGSGGTATSPCRAGQAHGTQEGAAGATAPQPAAAAASPLGDPASATGAAQVAQAPGAAAPAAGTPDAVDLVVVWDLDETLIIFNSLLSGQFVQALAAAHGRSQGSEAARAAAGVSPAPTAIPEADEGSGGTAVVRAVADGPAGAWSAAAVAGGESQAAASSAAVSERAIALGQQLADMVFSFCDDHMAFQVLDTTDPRSFSELWAQAATGPPPPTPDPAPGGFGLRGHPGAVHRATLERIIEVYSGGAQGLPGVLGEAGWRTLAAAMAEAESLTNGWVAAARRLLAGVTAAVPPSPPSPSPSAAAPAAGVSARLSFRRVRHVLVSAGHLVATLGKLLLWGLDEYFDIKDVYSASGCPKLEVFRALRGRYGPVSAYVAVGDGPEEERAAAHMGWGFVRVAMTEASPGDPRAEGSAAAAGPSGHGALAAAGAGGAEAGEGPSVRVTSRVRHAGIWQRPRPIGAIRPEDVLEAAREAYLNY